MADEMVRFGVVGCGGIADNLANSVDAVEGSTLVACADLDGERARALADEYGIENVYTDHGRMLDDATLDITIVATPNGTHGEIVIDCARAGVHVLCQKPLEITVARLDEMVSACEDHGVKLGGLYNLRYGDGTQATRSILENDRLGEIVLANGTLPSYRGSEYYQGWHGTADLDGGCLFTQSCHTIDRLAWFNDGIEWVFADTDTVAHDIETEDIATVAVRYGNGARGTISATTAVRGYPHYDRIDIHGEHGYVTSTHDEILSFEGSDGDVIEAENPYDSDGFAVQVRDMAEAVREDRDPIVPGTEARHAPDAILAMHESARLGEPVSVQAFLERARHS